MYPTVAREIAAQRIAELRQQAARQRTPGRLRVVGAASPVTGRVRPRWVRLSLGRSRPVTG